jgi:hypothetical protein
VAAAVWVTEIACQTSPHGTADLAAEIVVIRAGGTTPNIAAAHHIATVRPLTGLAVRREATRLLIVRLALDNSLAGRVAIWPAIGQVMEASETDSAEEGQTALEAGTSHEAVAEIETHSEVVRGVLVDTTDLAHAPTAAAVPPAWGREAGGSEAEAGVGAEAAAGRRHPLRIMVGSSY